MILETKPSEIQRLKRYDQLFQIVTWAVIVTAYGFSWLPLNIPINRLGVHLVVVTAALSEFLIYNVLPFEKHSGLLRYHYKLKGFVVGIMNHILISAYLVFTGGIASPFFFIYYLPLVSAAIYLPLWAVIFQLAEASILYIAATLVIAPALGIPLPGLWTVSLIPINISALAFVISLSYPQAKELAEESKRNLNLAEKISKVSEEIEGERNKLKVVISAISDGVIALDSDTRIILLNQAAERILKLKEAQVLGKPIDSVLQIFDENKKLSTLTFCPTTISKEDRVIFAKNDLNIKANNHQTYINLTSATIKEGYLANLGCILTFQDVTREKQLEQMKLDFVSIAVHELRTPLTTLRGYIALLEEKLSKKLNHQQQQDWQKIKIAAKQLSSLIENLLNVSRIERGALKLGITSTDWVCLVKRLVADFQDAACQKGLKLIFLKPKETIPPAAVDEFRIAEVLSNLLANAVNFTKKGQIVVEVKRQGEEIVTSVADTGIGIPKDAIPNLFTKFFRVSGILEPGPKGTGLGLFIAKSIVDLHHGKIWVETKEDQGSTFYFTVPVFAGKFKQKRNDFLKIKPFIIN